MAVASFSEESFDNACKIVIKTFGLDSFHARQVISIRELLHGKDVFVNLPTGSGKSLIFQSFPLVVDYLRGKCPDDHSIVVVVSPLVSLMKDQVNYLVSKGVNAAFLGEEQLDECIKDSVEKGKYQIVYGSPETFLAVTRWRKMLSNTVYRRNLCLLAVDEAHCISHWGFSAKKEEKIFRVWFRRINELRSLSKRVPVVALTATATRKTREQIMKTLEMKNATHVCEIPDRKNIAYAIEVVGSNPQETFQALIDEVRKKGRTCPRKIIYCPRIRIVSMIYGIFHAELGAEMYLDSKTCNPRERLVEMYHARVDEQNKEQILKSFSELDGCVRVLIATIAYGMGIDCKGVKDVIHYGPPQNPERYLQETGRAGRNGENGCKAILLYSNIMLKQCDEEMKSYILNNSATCRRKLLLSNFDLNLCELDRCNWPHECCDICQNKCECEDICKFKYFINKFSQESPVTSERHVTEEQKQKLKEKLDFLKESLNQTYLCMALRSQVPLLTSVDLLSGFGDCQIAQVMEHASKLISLSTIYQYVDIWHSDVAVDIGPAFWPSEIRTVIAGSKEYVGVTFLHERQNNKYTACVLLRKFIVFWERILVI